MEKDNLKHENPTDAKPILAVRATLKKQPKIYLEMEARRFDDEETKWNYRERYHKHDR